MKNDQNYEILFPLARSAEIFEYSVVILAEMVINSIKTGKNRPKRSKTGKISGFYFPCSAQFLPCFLAGRIYSPPGGALSAKIFTLAQFNPKVYLKSRGTDCRSSKFRSKFMFNVRIFTCYGFLLSSRQFSASFCDKIDEIS